MQAKDLILILLMVVISSCKGKGPDPVVAPPSSAQAQVPIASPEPPKEKPVYVYQGDRFRDPFIPAGQSSSYQSDAIFDPRRIALKAIIVGSGHNAAILSQSNGVSYYVKAGKIFDVMGKTVQGFTAKVFEDKILIVGEEDTQLELRLRNTDKQEKDL